MTYFSVAAGERAVNVRYMPFFAWFFAMLATYGISQIIARMASGLTPVNAGSFMAVGILTALMLFILFSGGQLVTASFDRAADLVRIRRYGLTGRQTEERRLSEVVGIDIRLLRRSQHRVELRLTSGERLPLTTYYVVTFNTSGITRLSERLSVPVTLIPPERA